LIRRVCYFGPLRLKEKKFFPRGAGSTAENPAQTPTGNMEIVASHTRTSECKSEPAKSYSHFSWSEGLGQVRTGGTLEAPIAETELVETAFNEHRLGLARRRRSYGRNDHAVTRIRPMRGHRQGNWNPDLGLAILAATQYPPHTQRVLANYMGVSRQRLQQIEKKALRKIRIRLMRQPQVWEALRDHAFKKC